MGFNQESQSAMESRLRETGADQAFAWLRKELRARGWNGKTSWRYCVNKFRKGYEEQAIDFVDDLREGLSEWPDEAVFIAVHGESQKGKGPKRRVREGAEAVKASDRTELAGERPEGEVPETIGAFTLEHLNWLKKSHFPNRKPVSSLEAIHWAFDHAFQADTRLEEAPGPGAWSLAVQLRNDPQMRKEFNERVLPRTLPSKTQIEDEQNRRQDDGSSVERLLEQFESMHGE